MDADRRASVGGPGDEQLKRLTEQVADFETRAGTPRSQEWSDTRLAELALTIHRGRSERARTFPKNLFAEPAWDILLDLFVHFVAGTCVSSMKLCNAANVPHATGLRWIATLGEHDLLRRYRPPHDARVQCVELTPKGYQLMREWLAAWMAEAKQAG